MTSNRKRNTDKINIEILKTLTSNRPVVEIRSAAYRKEWKDYYMDKWA
jgi:hypothetical protein